MLNPWEVVFNFTKKSHFKVFCPQNRKKNTENRTKLESMNGIFRS